MQRSFRGNDYRDQWASSRKARSPQIYSDNTRVREGSQQLRRITIVCVIIIGNALDEIVFYNIDVEFGKKL